MFIVVKKNDVFKAVIVAIVTVFLVAMTAVGGVAPVYLLPHGRPTEASVLEKASTKLLPSKIPPT